MHWRLLLLASALLAASHGPAAQTLRLDPWPSDSSILMLTAESAGPCQLPLPVSLEGAGRDLLLRLDRAPRPECSEADARAAQRFDLFDMVEGRIDGDGLHRIFMVDAEDPELSLGVSLIDLGEAPSWRAESGQWWPDQSIDADATGPGNGLFLEIQGDALSLVLATYDQEGRADWLMSAGRFDGRIYRGDLLRFSGGQAPFGAYRAPGTAERVAGVELAFTSPSRAELWLSRATDSGVQVQSWPITRFLFGRPADTRAWLGSWRVDADGGLPGRIDFTRPLADGVLDAGARFQLDCEPAATPETLPERCTLRQARGGGVLAEFEATALDSLSGHDREGRPLRLSRR